MMGNFLKLKTLFFLMFFIGLGLSVGYTQNKIVSYTVPVAIHNKFMQMNRGARQVQWIMHDYIYEVQFVQHREYKRHFYNQKGMVIEKRKQLRLEAVPKKIQQHCSKFPDYQLSKIEVCNKLGSTSYVVNLKKENTIMNLQYNRFGELVSKKENKNSVN